MNITKDEIDQLRELVGCFRSRVFCMFDITDVVDKGRMVGIYEIRKKMDPFVSEIESMFYEAEELLGKVLKRAHEEARH
ncbi:hypothetical protein FACS1894187_05190 [Synergistales bacterium]|nr:hypothetical protein FACS1894187_05190 [Synergistales bacterium]